MIKHEYMHYVEWIFCMNDFTYDKVMHMIISLHIIIVYDEA